jgi:hypothetical protein
MSAKKLLHTTRAPRQNTSQHRTDTSHRNALDSGQVEIYAQRERVGQRRAALVRVGHRHRLLRRYGCERCHTTHTSHVARLTRECADVQRIFVAVLRCQHACQLPEARARARCHRIYHTASHLILADPSHVLTVRIDRRLRRDHHHTLNTTRAHRLRWRSSGSQCRRSVWFGWAVHSLDCTRRTHTITVCVSVCERSRSHVQDRVYDRVGGVNGLVGAHRIDLSLCVRAQSGERTATRTQHIPLADTRCCQPCRSR